MKITENEYKILDISVLVSNNATTTKVTKIENEIPNITILLSKHMFNIKITEIKNKNTKCCCLC